MNVAAMLFTFIMILWVYFIWSRRKYYITAFKMPGAFGIPFIGIAHRLIKQSEILNVFPGIARENNTKTYFTWLGPVPVIYTMEPDFIELILTSPDTIDKSALYDQFSNVIGEGLFTFKAETWHKTRKLLTPSFSHKLLLDFFPNFNLLSRELCADFEKIVDNQRISLHDAVYKMALKSSVASTMGLDFKHINNPEFLCSLERLMALGSERIFKPWFGVDAIFRFSSIYKPFTEAKDIVMSFVQNLVLDKMKIHEQQKLEKNNNKEKETQEDSVDVRRAKQIFIDQIIRLGFSVDQVITEANFMVLAAFETTATSLYSTIMLLAMHPHYQEKVYEEICTVIPDEDSDVTYDDIENLVYLDMCLNESLRVLAPVPLIGREFSKDVRLSNGLLIPEGTNVLIDIFNTQRDEDIWGSDAKSYDPDRFLPSNFADKHKYCFLPFSKGPRNCLGWRYARMILKVTLANVLRKYRFSTDGRIEDLIFVQHITLRFDEMPELLVHRR